MCACPRANAWTDWRELLSERRQAVPSSRHFALDVAGHAGSADIGPHWVNPARRRHADLARQRRAPIPVAAHSRQFLVDELCRNEIERRVVLGGEPRPVRRIRAAGAAGLAGVADIDGRIEVFHGSGLARFRARSSSARDAGGYRFAPIRPVRSPPAAPRPGSFAIAPGAGRAAPDIFRRDRSHR
jgi:hypothetical protein